MSSVKKTLLAVEKAKLNLVLSYFDSGLDALKADSNKDNKQIEKYETAIKQLNYLNKKIRVGKAKFIYKLMFFKGVIYSINENGETNYDSNKCPRLSLEVLKELENRKEIIKLYFKDMWKKCEEDDNKREAERQKRLASIKNRPSISKTVPPSRKINNK